MKVIRPSEIAPAMLISSTATEIYPDWNNVTNYAVDAFVVNAGIIYQCIKHDVIPTYPLTSDILYWFDVGPSNTWAMFDQQTSTITSAENSLSVTIATGMIDSVALIGVSAYTAQLVLRDGLGGTIIFDETQGFSGDIPTDWYQYFFFDPLSARAQGIFQDLPLYQSTHMTLTLTGGGTVSIGNLVVGLRSDLGETEYGATAGIIDYSRKDTDAFGVTTFVKRAYSKRLSVHVTIPTSQLNRIQRLLYGIRAMPCVWLGTPYEEFEEPLIVYGFYRDFTTTIQYAAFSYCSLEIEGLI